MGAPFPNTTKEHYERVIAGPLTQMGQPAYCPSCAMPWQTVEMNTHTEREAPGWRGWPAEPPGELVREFIVSYDYTLTCSGIGHQHRFSRAPKEEAQ